MEVWGVLDIKIRFRGERKREIEVKLDATCENSEENNVKGSIVVSFRKLETGYKRVSVEADVNENIEHLINEFRDYVKSISRIAEESIPLP